MLEKEEKEEKEEEKENGMTQQPSSSSSSSSSPSSSCSTISSFLLKKKDHPHPHPHRQKQQQQGGVCGIHGRQCPLCFIPLNNNNNPLNENNQQQNQHQLQLQQERRIPQLVTLVFSITGGYVAMRVVCIPFKPENLKAQHTEMKGGLLKIFSTDSTGEKVLNSIVYSSTQLRMFSWSFSNITHVHVETEHPDNVLRPSVCGYEAQEICPKNVCGTVFLEDGRTATPSKRLVEAGMAVHKNGRLGHGWQIHGAMGTFTVSSNKPVITFSAARELEETVSFINSFLEHPCSAAPSVHMAVYSSRISHMVSFQVCSSFCFKSVSVPHSLKERKERKTLTTG